MYAQCLFGDCLTFYPLGSVPAYRLYSTVPFLCYVCVSVMDLCDVFEAVQSVPYPVVCY